MGEERGDAYIGRALHRLTADVASLNDHIKVLTAIARRHENTLARPEEHICDLARQMNGEGLAERGVADRLSGIEDRLESFDRRLWRVGG